MVYLDIESIPLDTWNGVDGDDSLLIDGKPLADLPTDVQIDEIAENERRVLSGVRGAVYVPFKRQIKLGTAGPDVVAVKRAMNKAAGRKIGSGHTRLFGVYAVRNLKTFQKSKGLKQDGVYGKSTHAKMAPYFDAYGRFLVGQTKVVSTAELKRQKIVSTAMHGYYNRYSIHYTQGSLRMQGVRQRLRPPAFPRYEDCSSFATWCYWVAGATDPNGLGYNGFGYTGTLAQHGRKISFPYAKPGDLIFYGGFPHNHVTVYVGAGRCVSHGSEAGPFFLPYNYRTVNSIRSYL